MTLGMISDEGMAEWSLKEKPLHISYWRLEIHGGGGGARLMF